MTEERINATACFRCLYAPISILCPPTGSLLFLCCIGCFFRPQPSAFQKLDALNVRQFNLQGVNYAVVMSVFAYALPGILLTGYFGWQLVRAPARFRVEAALLLVAGTLLLQLGVISTAPTLPGRTNYLTVLTWLFPTLHAAAWGWKALTGRADERRQRLTNAAMGLFLWYLVPGNILLGADQIDGRQVNLSIVLCFAWYASRRLFHAPPLPEVKTAPHAV